MHDKDTDIISSTQNPRIKHIVQLQQKSALRRKEKLFIVEGVRELTQCLNAGFQIDSLYVCEKILHQRNVEKSDSDGTDVKQLLANFPKNILTQVTEDVYHKIAYRGSTEGVLAVVKEKNASLAQLSLPDNPLLVVIEGVEKPGNIGAILRSADAAGVDAVLICDPQTDLHNPNLIRSSIGASFTVPCVVCESSECIRFLQTHNVQILTAQLQDSSLYYDTPMLRATAIVMGAEATGLSPQWRTAANAHIRIPMLGQVDSLNVSVSAAILMYEARRQRQSTR